MPGKKDKHIPFCTILALNIDLAWIQKERNSCLNYPGSNFWDKEVGSRFEIRFQQKKF
jgi:hypothetical protein